MMMKKNARRQKALWRQWYSSKVKPKAQGQKAWRQRQKKDKKTKTLNLKLEPKLDF
jgi:hypothetical protein